MSVVALGFGAAVALASGFWGISLALFVAGLGCAPALAAVSSVIAGSVDFADTAEAYGWVGTGQLLGASVGSAAAGIAIDHVGGSGGLMVSLAVVVLAVLVAVVFRRAQPDLRVPIASH
jgi:MFS family permease